MNSPSGHDQTTGAPAGDETLSAVRVANLVAKFGLELCMLAALAYTGSRLLPGPWGALPAIGLPVLAVLVWGRWAAPRSPRRLSTGPRVVLEMTMFVATGVGLAAADRRVESIAFVVLVAINAALLTLFDQWDG